MRDVLVEGGLDGGEVGGLRGGGQAFVLLEDVAEHAAAGCCGEREGRVGWAGVDVGEGDGGGGGELKGERHLDLSPRRPVILTVGGGKACDVELAPRFYARRDVDASARLGCLALQVREWQLVTGGWSAQPHVRTTGGESEGRFGGSIRRRAEVRRGRLGKRRPYMYEAPSLTSRLHAWPQTVQKSHAHCGAGSGQHVRKYDTSLLGSLPGPLIHIGFLWWTQYSQLSRSPLVPLSLSLESICNHHSVPNAPSICSRLFGREIVLLEQVALDLGLLQQLEVAFCMPVR